MTLPPDHGGRSLATSALAAAALLLTVAALPAADWPQFRGPNGDGVSPETGLDLTWGAAGPTELWRVPLGEGYSGIAAVDGRLYTLFAAGGDELIAAFDAESGRKLWRHRLDDEYRDGQGDGPRATPTVADGTVYALGARGVLAALAAADGAERWRVDLKRAVDARPPTWGVSASPLVEGDLLVVNAGGRSGAAVVALERDTGEVAWSAGDDKAGYAAPLPVEVGGVRQLLLFTGTRLSSLSPRDGSVHWSLPWKTSYDVNAAVPVVVPPNKVFVSSGYDVGGAMLRLGAEGGRGTMTEIWRSRGMKNQFSASVYRDGVLYGFDNGTLKAIDARDGADLWRARGLGHGSLIWADGRLVILGERCELVVAEATPEEFRPLARHQILEGKCWTAPTLSDGRLVLRNESEMVALDVGGGR